MQRSRCLSEIPISRREAMTRAYAAEHHSADLFLKLRSLRPYLWSRMDKIQKEGRGRQLREEVEDIEYFLSVMSDVCADDHHSSDALQGYIDRIHEMMRLNPNDYVNSDDEEFNVDGQDPKNPIAPAPPLKKERFTDLDSFDNNPHSAMSLTVSSGYDSFTRRSYEDVNMREYSRAVGRGVRSRPDITYAAAPGTRNDKNKERREPNPDYDRPRQKIRAIAEIKLERFEDSDLFERRPCPEVKKSAKLQDTFVQNDDDMCGSSRVDDESSSWDDRSSENVVKNPFYKPPAAALVQKVHQPLKPKLVTKSSASISNQNLVLRNPLFQGAAPPHIPDSFQTNPNQISPVRNGSVLELNQMYTVLDPRFHSQNPRNSTGQNPSSLAGQNHSVQQQHRPVSRPMSKNHNQFRHQSTVTLDPLFYSRKRDDRARFLDPRTTRPYDWRHSPPEEQNKNNYRGGSWNKSATAYSAGPSNKSPRQQTQKETVANRVRENLQLSKQPATPTKFSKLQLIRKQFEKERFHLLGRNNSGKNTVEETQPPLPAPAEEESPPRAAELKSPGPRNVARKRSQDRGRKGKRDDGIKKRFRINKKSLKAVTSDMPAAPRTSNRIPKTRLPVPPSPLCEEEASEDEDMTFETEELVKRFIRQSMDPEEADSILKSEVAMNQVLRGLKEQAESRCQTDEQHRSPLEKLCFTLKKMGFEANIPTKTRKSNREATAKSNPVPVAKTHQSKNAAKMMLNKAITENNYFSSESDTAISIDESDATSEVSSLRGMKRKHDPNGSSKVKAKKKKKGPMTRAQLAVKAAKTEMLKNKKRKLESIPGIVTNPMLTKIKLECDYIVPKQEPIEEEDYFNVDWTKYGSSHVNEEDDRMSIESINIKNEPDDVKDEEKAADLNTLLTEPDLDIDDEWSFTPRIEQVYTVANTAEKEEEFGTELKVELTKDAEESEEIVEDLLNSIVSNVVEANIVNEENRVDLLLEVLEINQEIQDVLNWIVSTVEYDVEFESQMELMTTVYDE